MLLVQFVLFLIITVIGAQSSPVNVTKLLQYSSIEPSDLLEDVPTEIELALERLQDEATPEPVVVQKCLKLGAKCINSKVPCYQTQKMKNGEILITEGVCFIFGQGQCEARKNIVNYEKYIQLVKKINNSNHRKLFCEYWKDLLPPFFIGLFQGAYRLMY